jgi:hypothetical protein
MVTSPALSFESSRSTLSPILYNSDENRSGLHVCLDRYDADTFCFYTTSCEMIKHECRYCSLHIALVQETWHTLYLAVGTVEYFVVKMCYLTCVYISEMKFDWHFDIAVEGRERERERKSKNESNDFSIENTQAIDGWNPIVSLHLLSGEMKQSCVNKKPFKDISTNENEVILACLTFSDKKTKNIDESYFCHYHLSMVFFLSFFHLSSSLSRSAVSFSSITTLDHEHYQQV